MKTKVDCPNCDAAFTVNGPYEPNYCCFCAEPIKLYGEDPMLEEMEDLQDDELDEEELDELFGEDFEEDEDDD